MLKLNVVLGCVHGGQENPPREIKRGPPHSVKFKVTGVDVVKRNEKVVSSKKRKKNRQRNAEHRDNNRRYHCPRKVVSLKVFVARVVGKVLAAWESVNATGAQLRVLQQLKGGGGQAAERKQDEMPKHMNARWTAENAIEPVETAQEERQEDKEEKIDGRKVCPGQAVQGVQVATETHPKAPVKIQSVGDVLVAVRLVKLDFYRKCNCLKENEKQKACFTVRTARNEIVTGKETVFHQVRHWCLSKSNLNDVPPWKEISIH